MVAHSIPMAIRLANNSVPVPESGCWIWLGSEKKGYGQTSEGGRSALAHRASFQEFNGPIPEGMQVCHKCDTPLCINPDHLFLGSALVNARDKVKKGRQSFSPRKTHCVRRHAFTDGNTYLRPDGGRSCRQCNAMSAAKAKARRKQGEGA